MHNAKKYMDAFLVIILTNAKSEIRSTKMQMF